MRLCLIGLQYRRLQPLKDKGKDQPRDKQMSLDKNKAMICSHVDARVDCVPCNMLKN